MALDVTGRGALENLIDTGIGTVPKLVRGIQLNMLMVKEPPDYLVGFVHGMILGNLMMVFKGIKDRDMTEEEISEALKIMFRRTGEIREAIFKAG